MEYFYSKVHLVVIVQACERGPVVLKGSVGQDTGISSTLSFLKCQAMLNVHADTDRNQRSRNK